MNKKIGLRMWIYISLLAFASVVIIFQIYNPTALLKVVHEDGITENLTVELYLGSSLIFFYLLKKQKFHNIWYLGLGLLSFFMAGEELSWGQRIFHLSTPKYLETINYQQEINLHNIKMLHARAVGLLIILAIYFIVPITNKLVPKLNLFYEKHKFPIYPLWAIGIPAIIIFTHVIPKLIFNSYPYAIEEIGETSLSVAFFLFAVSEFCNFRNKQRKV